MFYGKYVSVAEKRHKAERKLKALKKKNPGIQPVIIQGRSLAKNWWGKAWNKNLESYADYANRIGRGRSYVRHMAVLDLKIEPGKIKGLVQGSTSTPYKVDITIKPMAKTKWEQLKKKSRGRLGNLKDILGGKFPQEMEEIFTLKGQGLFPSPEEIELDCSCPDWAVMCKHVAAVLYGAGARLDDDPALFFVLRKVKIEELISQTLEEGKKDLLTKSKAKSSRVIKKTSGLSELFGIDLADATPLPTPKKPHRLKDRASIETLFKRRTKRKTSVSELIEKSDMPPQKVRNILSQLSRQGKIKRISRGVYKGCPGY